MTDFRGKHDDPAAVAPVYTARVKAPGYSPTAYQVFGSVAEVRATVVYSGDTIRIPYVGEYKWDAASTADDDGLSVIQITGVTTGRWLETGAYSVSYGKNLPGATVSIGTASQVDILSVALTGLATSTTYACTLGARATVWVAATPSLSGNLDCTVDMCVTTSAAGTVTCSFQQTPYFDASRAATALASATATVAATTGGFKISATPPAGVACIARAKYWIDALEVVS